CRGRWGGAWPRARSARRSPRSSSSSTAPPSGPDPRAAPGGWGSRAPSVPAVPQQITAPSTGARQFAHVPLALPLLSDRHHAIGGGLGGANDGRRGAEGVLVCMERPGRGGRVPDRWRSGVSLARRRASVHRIPPAGRRRVRAPLSGPGLPPALGRFEHAGGTGGGTTVKRILVPLDGSRLSEAIMPLAKALARDYDAELRLVRPLSPRGSADAEVQEQEDAEAYLRTMAARVARRDVP